MDDGGPVFPCTRMETTTYRPAEGEPREIEVQVTYLGLSLRDYFAAHLAPVVQRCANDDYRADLRDDPPTLTEVASDAYRLADAMLRARKQGAST